MVASGINQFTTHEMATVNNKTPPYLIKAKSYSDWIRLLRLWTKFIDLDSMRQGPALIMTLEGKALDTILQLDDSEIADKGVNKIINKLNGLYKKGKLNARLRIYKSVKPKKGHPTLPCNSLFDFDHAYNKLRRHDTNISDDLLSFKLLKAANISAQQEQLIKATISEINYDNIAKKIKSIFSSDTETRKQNNIELNIKDEATYYSKETTSEEEEYENDNESHNELCDTYYIYEKQKKTNKFTSRNQPHATNQSQHNFPPKASIWRNNQPNKPTKGRNPHKNGQPTRCNICQSTNHWATQCPDKNMDDITYMVHEIILQILTFTCPAI